MASRARRRGWIANAARDPEFVAHMRGELVQLAQSVIHEFQCDYGVAVGPFPASPLADSDGPGQSSAAAATA